MIQKSWQVLNEEEDYKKFVNEFKDHPLVIGCYINEEMTECFNEHIRNRALKIHELDPDHPTVSVTNGGSQHFIQQMYLEVIVIQ